MKMKLVLILLGCTVSAMGVNEKIVKSSVKNVTVFTQGAQVYRSASFSIPQGSSEIVIQGVSAAINPASIQAGGKGEFTITDVRHTIKYPEPPKPVSTELPKEVQKEISMLEDSLSEIGFRREALEDKKTSLLMEKDMIMKNKLSHGEGKSDSLPILKQAMEFFRVKLNDINTQLNSIKREEARLDKTTNGLNERLNDLRAYKNQEPQKKYEPVHQIIVGVTADQPTSGIIEVNYMVNGAGWVPTYDLRSSSPSAPVTLTYKANVYQNTGEEWNDVNLRLSTSDPNRSTVKPALPVWYLNYYNTPRQVTLSSKAARDANVLNSVASDANLSKAEDDIKSMPPAQSAANYSQLIESMTNVMFDISLPYTIPSDGANHLVSIKNGTLPATYFHYLVPKMESEAFLVAKVTGWDDLSLLPGQANVFFDGTYVGQTVINPAVINDTMELSLGRDNGITITRTKLPIKENSKLLGSDITKTFAYELRMKNSRGKAINLIVEDQIPVAQSKEIKVEMKNKGDAEYNEQTGLLQWKLNLDPKAYKTLGFSFEVTYDKNKALYF